MAHILVIDDDAVLRRVITLSLEAAGHTVLRCENGRKAVDFLAHDHADLLITDILMPEMDGVETVRAARRLQPNLPILAISGGGSFAPDDYLGIARAFGATDVLRKPFHPPDLVERVTKMLAAPVREHGGLDTERER
jgi:CheY-like chemotaxis protein